MSAKITQDNLYMLLPLKIGWLAPWLSEDKGISLTEEVMPTGISEKELETILVSYLRDHQGYEEGTSSDSA